MESYPSEEDINLVAAVCWIPKGVHQLKPTITTKSQKEEMVELAESDLQDDDDEEEKEAIKEEPEEDGEDNEVMNEYNMKNYDKEDDFNTQFTKHLLLNPGQQLTKEDPYLKKTPKKKVDEDSDEDYELSADDRMLVVISNEEFMSQLLIYVYEEDEHNLFVHHDIMISNFGLCVEWLGFYPGRALNQKTHNLCAVGTFDPFIEIWDLDVVDPLEPVAILGSVPEEIEPVTTKSKKKKNAKLKQIKQNVKGAATADPSSKSLVCGNGHTEGVLGLSWNKKFVNFLASCSEDATVKVWDLQRVACVTTLTHHTDKVHNIEWHPTDSNLLLTASYDSRACLMDPRQASKSTFYKLMKDSSVECMRWNEFNTEQFITSYDSGHVACYDRRKPDPVYQFQAHTSSCTDFSFYGRDPKSLVTCSMDKKAKVWKLEESTAPALIYSINVTNPLFAAKTSDKYVAVGGDRGLVRIVDVEKTFKRNNVLSSNPQDFKRAEETLEDDQEATIEEDDDDDDDDDDIEEEEEEDDEEEEETIKPQTSKKPQQPSKPQPKPQPKPQAKQPKQFKKK